jgi:hypothetical protein
MPRGPCRLLRSIFRLAYWKPTCSRLVTLKDRRACLSNSHCLKVLLRSRKGCDMPPTLFLRRPNRGTFPGSGTFRSSPFSSGSSRGSQSAPVGRRIGRHRPRPDGVEVGCRTAPTGMPASTPSPSPSQDPPSGVTPDEGGRGGAGRARFDRRHLPGVPARLRPAPSGAKPSRFDRRTVRKPANCVSGIHGGERRAFRWI